MSFGIISPEAVEAYTQAFPDLNSETRAGRLALDLAQAYVQPVTDLKLRAGRACMFKAIEWGYGHLREQIDGPPEEADPKELTEALRKARRETLLGIDQQFQNQHDKNSAVGALSAFFKAIQSEPQT